MFVYIKSEILKPFYLQLCIFYVNRGKNMHFLPFFLSPFNIFSPEPVIWSNFCPPPRGQTEKYIPLRLNHKPLP